MVRENMLRSLSEYVGNTPMIQLVNKKHQFINFYAKLEGWNPSGSVKDRAALAMLKWLLENKIIDLNTTIIESSSGNFGVALALYCKHLELEFTCVIDPKIQPINRMILEKLGANVVCVEEKDKYNGYLNARLKKVSEIQTQLTNSFWINQYTSYQNSKGYRSLGEEILKDVKADYIFLGVSSGSTITGVSDYVKEMSSSTRIIAVDVEGSVVFGGKPGERRIPGIGSCICPPILKFAHIDDIVCVSEDESCIRCQELLSEHGVFVGGSSGSVYAAVLEYVSSHDVEEGSNIVMVFPDRGDRYGENVFGIKS